MSKQSNQIGMESYVEEPEEKYYWIVGRWFVERGEHQYNFSFSEERKVHYVIFDLNGDELDRGTVRFEIVGDKISFTDADDVSYIITMNSKTKSLELEGSNKLTKMEDKETSE